MIGDRSVYTCPDCGAVFNDFDLASMHREYGRCLVREYEREHTLRNRIALHSESPKGSMWARIVLYNPETKIAECRLLAVEHVNGDGEFHITCGLGKFPASELELTTLEHMERFLDVTVSDSIGKVCKMLEVSE